VFLPKHFFMASYAATQVLNKTVFPLYKGSVDTRKRPFDLGASQNPLPAASANPVNALEYYRGKNRFEPYNQSGLKYMRKLAQRAKLMQTWELYARLHLREYYKQNGSDQFKENGDGTISYRRPQYQFYAEPARLNMLDYGVDPMTNNEEAIFDLSKRLGRLPASKNQGQASLAAGMPRMPQAVAQPTGQTPGRTPPGPAVSQIAPSQSTQAPAPTQLQQTVNSPTLLPGAMDAFDPDEALPDLANLFNSADADEQTPHPTHSEAVADEEPQINDSAAQETVDRLLTGTPLEQVVPEEDEREDVEKYVSSVMAAVHRGNTGSGSRPETPMAEELPGTEPSTIPAQLGEDPTNDAGQNEVEEGSTMRTPVRTAPETPQRSPAQAEAPGSARRRQLEERVEELEAQIGQIATERQTSGIRAERIRLTQLLGQVQADLKRMSGSPKTSAKPATRSVRTAGRA